MVFASEFEFNDKLKDCARRNQDHIGERFAPFGRHVHLIQKALNAWAESDAPSLVLEPTSSDFSTETFGPATAKLVRAYKTKNRILNHKGKVDEIVGIKTIAALDKELPRRGAAPIDPPTPTKETIDSIVKFIVAPGLLRENLFEGEPVLRDEACNDYEKKHPGRKLVRVGHTTAAVEDEAARIVDRVAKFIDFKLSDANPGKIFIFGSSSGRRAALDLAVRLTNDQRPLEYVAPIDAAFFPNSRQLTNRPTELFGHSKVVPQLALPNIKAERRECFFQTIGNKAKQTLRHGKQFTSDMAGQEIHGNVLGFTPMNRDSEVKRKAGLRATDDSFHELVTEVALPEVRRTIVGILSNL